MRLIVALLAFVFTLSTGPLLVSSETAPPLKHARVDEVAGDVSLRKTGDKVEKKAALNDQVTGADIIRTGKKSRAELEFADKSICRLGSNTIFSFDPNSRDMAFARGIAVVHVPPGKGGARIATPAATAAIQGDTLVVRAVVLPDGKEATQFTALSPKGGPTDGNIIITLNGNPNVSFRLDGGHFAVVPKDATALSQVPRAEIDLGTFSKTSPILQGLPQSAKAEMKMVTDSQFQAFDSGSAKRTDMAIVGTQVVRDDGSGTFGLPPPGSPPPPTGSTPPPPTDGTAPLLTSGGTFDAQLGGTPPPPGPNPFAPAGSLPPPGTQSFTQIIGNSLMPPPPPGGMQVPTCIVAIFNPLTLSGAVTIDTSLGTITGALANQFDFQQGSGIGMFCFDRVTFNGANILVQGSNQLYLHGEANSGAPGIGNSITFSGATTTFNFGGGTPRRVEFDAERGDVAIGANVTANGADLNIVSRQGTVLQTAGTIDTSVATSVSNGGRVGITSAGNANVSSIATSGGAGFGGNVNASNGGDIAIQSNTGTVNLGGGLYLNADGGATAMAGGSGGAGGHVNIVGNAISPSTGSISANGGGVGAGGVNAGMAGTIDVRSNGPGTTTFVGGLTATANGGNSNSATIAGALGGTVSVTSAAINIPTGVLLAAKGGGNAALGGSGSGGNVILVANGAAGTTTVTGSGIPVLSANAGLTGGAQGNGGTVGLGAPAGPNVFVTGSGTVVSATGGAPGIVKVTDATNVGGGLTNPTPTVGPVP